MPLGTPAAPYVLQRVRTTELQDFPYIAPDQVQTCAIDFGNFLPTGVTLTGTPTLSFTVHSGIDPNPSSRVLTGPQVGTIPTTLGGTGITNAAVQFQLGTCLGSVIYLISLHCDRSDGDVAQGWSHIACVAPE